MPLYHVKMKNEDGTEFRDIELAAEDEDEAKFICESQARALAAEDGSKPYTFVGKPKEIK